ncbi:MAG: endonuclease, partial [Dysgonomonas sp.]
PFGEVGIATWTSTNGSKLGKNTSDGYTGTVFEPIDEYKGDFARTYFYMATCYEDKIAGWYSNSEAQAALNGTKYPAYKDWYIKLMLKWSREDPVSQKEIDRNNAAYAVQKNRNPYIDFPGLEEYVWGTKQDIAFDSNNPGGTDPRISVEPAALTFSSNDINVTSSQTINVKAYNLTGDLQVALSGDNVFTTSSSTISKTAAESSAGYDLTVNFKPTAYVSNSGVLSISGGGLAAATSVNVTGITSTFSGEILNVPFKTTLSPFTQYSVLGTQIWTQDATNGYAKMSGYVSPTNYQNEDWLISPSMDLTDFISAILTFDHTGRMFDALPTMKSDLTLWVSSNYVSGAPATATWSQLTIPNYMTGEDWVFVSSGDIALSPLLDKDNAHLAFKYVSTSTYAGNWEIKNVLVKGTKGQSSIDDNDTDSSVSVYVTPGYLNIYVYSDTESITIYDALGKQLIKQKANSGENRIAVTANQLLFVKVGNRITKVLSR